MRVKMQYTVELEEVPKEVIKLLPAQPDFTPEVALLEDLIHEGKTTKALEMLESTRILLYQTDQRLADCHQVLQGYLGVKAAQDTENKGAQDDSAS